MRKLPSIEQCRAGGRERAKAFTSEYQSEMGRRRARQLSFLAHNQKIAPDGFSAMSAYFRGPSGLRLLQPEHIQFLQPQQLRGQRGARLSYEQQRILFGVYVWQAIWQDLAPQPNPPTEWEWRAKVAQVQDRLQHGLPLGNPLDVIFASPGDFCDETGEPWSPRKQRRLFRQAFAAGRQAAIEHTARAIAEYVATGEWQLGQRRPMEEKRMPICWLRPAASSVLRYGRPDLPGYHPYNVMPQRPYGIASSNDTHPVYWLKYASQVEEPDEY